jgi:hypothetical protein
VTKTNGYKILFANLKGGRLFGKYMCTCKNNIKVDLKEAGARNVNWI